MRHTPTIFVIFGVTGHLSRTKILPALIELKKNDHLPDQYHIIGVAHTDHTNDSFKGLLQDNISAIDADFLEHVSYVKGGFEEVETYTALAHAIDEVEKSFGQCTNKLFHLSVSPRFYGPLLENIAVSGVGKACETPDNWARILIEKPFGNDLQSARELDARLGTLFDEDHIFRIDHYLGKETIQNLIAFRFSNALFTPAWNDEHIEKMEFELHESVDASDRGTFYDAIGALRDVGQNHLLQMFALMTMGRPEDFSAHHIREKRADILDSFSFDTNKEIIRGQYTNYLTTKGVQPDSQTETFFQAHGKSTDPDWQNTAFIFSAGKAMDQKITRITVTFREPNICLCDREHGDTQNNQIIFDIAPEEKITVRFFAKKHGLSSAIIPKDLTFSYHDQETQARDNSAYEKIIYDAILGDHTLFTSTREVMAAWSSITDLCTSWDDQSLKIYPQGASHNQIIK